MSKTADTAAAMPARASVPSPLAALQPEGWPTPRGYANGMAGEGRMVLTGGQIGWTPDGVFPPDFLGQIRQTLENVVAVVGAAGGGPEHIARLTWYVTDIDAYRECLKELGPVYREVMGRNFPAMAVVQVVALVEPEAKVEIEGTAILPI
ncbi:RidA family protein [Stappia indica]|uniref:Enamine deaminase RidA, house cleaning of reactive enamine intermediates, YjgF/YER057c/UK114 family n=1 Tax=Stappia indica TaxID=538381 RepID=A0A285RRR0_9HYPH|nr:RidA family protein [Stappia indica]MCC4246297.1 RidA family protein [Stappia indica]SOB96759.1 Enamine deaminase RidA, house cleaning of reactive enamine intermediates, YjgF/YER057c/UK114 family [Stappia indica]